MKKVICILLLSLFSLNFLNLEVTFAQNNLQKLMEVLNIDDNIKLQYNDTKCENLINSYNHFKIITSLLALEAKLKIKSMLNKNTDKNIDRKKFYINELKNLYWMPISMENYLGERMHLKRYDILPKKGRYKVYYEKAEDLLNKILNNVDQEIPYNFKIYLIRGNNIDIFSYPGGYIYLTRRVLDNTNFAKLAIAHEVAHILKRHYIIQYQRIVLDMMDKSETLDKLIDDLKNFDKNKEKFKKIFDIIGKIFLTKENLIKLIESLNQGQELEADSCAIRLLSNEDNLNEIVNDFLKKLSDISLKEENINNKKLEKLFDLNISTHPTNKKRYENIKMMLIEINKNKSKQNS